MGLQKRMTLKHTKLLKQANITKLSRHPNHCMRLFSNPEKIANSFNKVAACYGQVVSQTDIYFVALHFINSPLKLMYCIYF